MAPQRLAVEAKELISITPLREKPRNSRLDLWPFGIVYAAWAAYVVSWVAKHGFEDFYLVQLATYAILAVHALTFLSGVWSAGLKARIRFAEVPRLEQASHLLVVPHAFVGGRDVVPLESKPDGAGGQRFAFSFCKLRFVHDAATGAVTRLQYPVNGTVGEYLASPGMPSDAAVTAADDRWGSNKFEVPVPSFGSLLLEQLLAPFFCFQVFCVGLWALDEYWYYSLFTLFMLVTFECTVVVQRIKNLMDIRKLQAPKRELNVYRGGKWAKIPGDALVPGDVVSILREEAGDDVVVQADMLLLAGGCIADEAVLTGESTPQRKAAIDAQDEGGAAARLDVQRDRAHIVFGGTKLLQTTGDKTARLRTPDGQLMRTILYSTEKVSANNIETFLFIGFLLFWAIAASGYVLYYGLADPDRDRFKLVLNCIMILTSVVPPELPMELTIAVNASLLALSKLKVFCTEPFRIPLAGAVTTCCFDKTGTLTSDHFVLEGVAGLEDAAFKATAAPGGSKGSKPAQGKTDGIAGGSSQETEVVAAPHPEGLALAGQLPVETARILAACQSLVQVDKELVGDPLEKVALESVGWVPRGANSVRSPDSSTASPRETVEIVHRYAFSSALKRMSTVVTVASDAAGTATAHWVLTKGAPEVVRRELAVVPEGYDTAYRRFASQGARVLALACRRLDPGLAPADLRQLPRESAEQGLTFAGFAVFRSPLKPDSAPTCVALRTSGHQLVMITGDAALTACHAAAAVQIVVRPVLILDPSNSVDGAGTGNTATKFSWVSPDESVRVPFDPSAAAAGELAASHDLCLTGEGLDALAALPDAGAALSTYIPVVSVYARVTPEHKELVVRALRAAGLGVLMCGDGTNDVGALKGAQVGVALLAPPEKKKKKTTKVDGKSSGTGKNLSKSSGATVATGEADAQEKLPPGPGTKMLQDLERKGKKITPFMRRMAKSMDDMAAAQAAAQGGLEDGAMVKPGDASMASPFTAKVSSVAPCLDILRQGRCTLVTTMQMFRILGLLCLSSAYSLSVQYMDGIKLGDLQATMAGVLTAGMFFFISNAKPLTTLSRQRPHARVFSRYMLVSLLGQFAVHISFLMYMQRLAHDVMPPDEKQEPDTPFKPNLINTICFLVNFGIQTMTFAVNYVGAPFNTPLQENRYFALSINYSVLAYVLLVLDVPPGIRTWFSLVPIPASMQYKLLGLGALAFVATSLIERTARALFPAPTPPGKGGLRQLDAAHLLHRQEQ